MSKRSIHKSNLESGGTCFQPFVSQRVRGEERMTRVGMVLDTACCFPLKCRWSQVGRQGWMVLFGVGLCDG